SSGKSSSLSLIHLLNQEKFWQKNQLYFEDYYYFGTYPDITNNKDNISFGIYKNKSLIAENKDYLFNSILLSFSDSNGGTPYINTIHFIGDNPVERKIIEVFLKDDLKQFPLLFARIHDNYDRKNNSDFLFENELNIYVEDNISQLVYFPHKTIYYMIDTSLEMRGLSFSKSFPNNKIYWFAPIRTKPQRTYDQYIENFTADGKHIPYLLRNIVNNKSEKNQAIIEAIDEFGKKSGLYEKMIVKQYGESINAPFEIQFQLADGTYRISNVGYGVSQVLPLIVQILADQEDGWFMIQQPEVHLHPKAQSALGEFLFAAFEKGKKIFVETHSDFIIDGFRRKLGESPEAASLAEQAQVVFFEKEGEGNQLNCIDIEADGEYKMSEATERFRSFFVQEALQNIGL
ncbi:MAG: AAA family ATPase, partial [Chitinophagales bacterium]